ncbi:MAG TPA: hypothetical protein VID27_00265 [Blastocatellia bacterium]
MNEAQSLMKVVAIAILCTVPSVMPAATQRRKAGTDVNELRKSFVEIFGQDFELLSDEVREKSGGKYWLAIVRTKRSGTFIFRHKFEQPYSYRYQDRECRIFVGEKGCSRTLRHDLRPQYFCVGDRVIIPFLIGDRLTNHAFSRVSRFPHYYYGPFESGLDERGVDNPIQDHLKYLGRESHVAVDRSGREASVTFNAFFEAAEVGRFNFSLSPHIPGEMQHYSGKAPQLFITSVVIVPQESPVTALVAEESIYEKDENSENPRVSSSGGTDYPTSVLMLRPGDRVSLNYGRTHIPNNKQTQDLVKEVEPVIKLLPFSIDPRSYFNDWIIDHVLR